MFNFKDAEFDYEPYPICYIPSFLDKQKYIELAETYPDLNSPNLHLGESNKYSLAEISNKKLYHDFLNQNKAWKEVYDYIKSRKFVEDTFEFLAQHNIDLGIKRYIYTNNIDTKKRSLIQRARNKTLLRSRFEFSAMSANKGHILPHTDSKNKLVTLVISFVKPGEWQAEWGGGTDMILPKDRTQTYNQINKYGKFEDMDVIKSFPFNSNQCVLFIKTYNSWHSVTPMTGPQDALRKTLTINIENLT